MKISERTIKRLGEIITGDGQVSPYRSGPQLVSFFNELGCNNVYDNGFPSRWKFAEEKIRKFNDTPDLKKVIFSALDPRDFLDGQVLDKKTNEFVAVKLSDAMDYLNNFLDFDGYEVTLQGKYCRLIDKARTEISFSADLEADNVSHDFIREQAEKCRLKIENNDFDGAITNARSLIEAVLIDIERKLCTDTPDYDGNLPKLYKRVQKHLNLSPDNDRISDSLKQTLTGFVSIISGLSGLSNKMGDRHARKYKPKKHHAILLVNSSMTISNFIYDTYAYQHL